MRLLGISGSLTLNSKTYIAIQKAIQFAADYDSTAYTEVLSLGDYELQFCDGRDPVDYDGDTRMLIDKIIEADALLIGTPIYRGSMTGALKNVFDLIPNDALQGKVIGFIATGGTYHHYLAIEHQLKPLAGYFRAHVVPGAVYAHNEHYSDFTLVDAEISERLRELGETTVRLHRKLGRDDVGARAPSIPRKSLLY